MRYFVLLGIIFITSCGVSTPESPHEVVKPTMPRPEPVALASLKNCIACHNATGNMVGPSWQNIANKYKGQTNAVNHLTDKVLAGGSGNFGVVAMPPQATKLTPDEARYIVEWVLTNTSKETSKVIK